MKMKKTKTSNARACANTDELSELIDGCVADLAEARELAISNEMHLRNTIAFAANSSEPPTEKEIQLLQKMLEREKLLLQAAELADKMKMSLAS